MSEILTIVHLYPAEMNIYGDMGNIIALRKRLEWRGYKVRIESVEIGKTSDLSKADIIFGGGGQDSGQLVVGPDLIRHSTELKQMARDGLPMLVVCGLYQLFGRGFITLEGQELPGIGVFEASTTGSSMRMIGNICIETKFGRLVGFENHSGQTELEQSQAALGRVVKGFGNNQHRVDEGAVSFNAIGTYLHGPLLPKNPVLADHIILTALKRRWNVQELEPLDDTIELQAADVAARRPQ